MNRHVNINKMNFRIKKNDLFFFSFIFFFVVLLIIAKADLVGLQA